MKIVKSASGKKILKMSRKEWLRIGERSGWDKDYGGGPLQNYNEDPASDPFIEIDKAPGDNRLNAIAQNAKVRGKNFAYWDLQLLIVNAKMEHINFLHMWLPAILAEETSPNGAVFALNMNEEIFDDEDVDAARQLLINFVKTNEQKMKEKKIQFILVVNTVPEEHRTNITRHHLNKSNNPLGKKS